MIRKTALLTGIAGAILMAAPALAQDAMSPTQDPVTANPGQPAPVSGTLQLQPGTNVKGSDGSVFGKLEGVRSNDAGEQELTVRGVDGQVRGVPLGGLRQEGADVTVAWTSTEFTAAPTIAAEGSAAPEIPPVSDSMVPPADDPIEKEPDTATDGATPPPTEFQD